MKKNRLFFMFAALFVAAVVLFSCQKEEVQDSIEGLQLKSSSNCSSCIDNWVNSKEDFVSAIAEDFYIEGWNDGTKAYIRVYRKSNTFTRVEDFTVKQNGNTIYGPWNSPVGGGAAASITCPDVILTTPWAKCDYIEISMTAKGVGGGGGKVVTNAKYYLREISTSTTLSIDNENPVCVGEMVVLTATVGAGEAITGGVLKITDASNVTLASVPVNPEVTSVTYAYTPATAGSTGFKAVYERTSGYCESESGVVNVKAEECDLDCSENFSYVPNPDGSYTFTYTPIIDMTGAKVVFTFAQSAEVELDGFIKNGTTMQANIDFTACEPVSWTVKFIELRCTGKGQTNVNAWTDFKINGKSKKNSNTPNIVLPCN